MKMVTHLKQLMDFSNLIITNVRRLIHLYVGILLKKKKKLIFLIQN
jgi:hypothetical protein